MKKVIVVGSGNAALCAAIAALEKGAEVTVLEKASESEAGGNSKYTAGAMRFAYSNSEDLYPLLLNPNDSRLPVTDFGSYPKDKFTQDLLKFNDGRPVSLHQQILIDSSYDTMKWLGTHNVRFEPIYERQSFEKNGKHIFWGGLTLAAKGEGVGLIEAEMDAFFRLGGKIQYNTEVTHLLLENDTVTGVSCVENGSVKKYTADAVILGSGGFEASATMRKKYMGAHWENSLVRGTRHNTGKGIEMALEAGAQFYGLSDGCHAVPMDMNMPNYGNLDIPYIDRKNYRKICYFLGVMLNANGERFVDEGKDFRNYTYAQFGRALLHQPGGYAWQIFDAKVSDLLYGEYRFWDASFVEAETIEELVTKLEGVDSDSAIATLEAYNKAVDTSTAFDPTSLDGRAAIGVSPPRSNWANQIDTPPFRAYPVRCGITFTYAGLKVDKNAAVLNENEEPIQNLYACGELVGGVFYNGYPGGSGLTSGAVFGRIAGFSAAQLN